MAKTKAKKITATNITIATKREPTPISIVYGDGDDAIVVPVKSYISLTERMSMVRDIAEMAFVAGDDGEIEYVPSIRKFAIDYEIVNYFTDIALPSSTDAIWRFFEATGIAQDIANALPCGYIADIIGEADELIEYRKQALLKKSKLDGVLDSVLGLVDTVGKKTENVDFSQILSYVQTNNPELAGEVEQIIKTQVAESAAV